MRIPIAPKDIRAADRKQKEAVDPWFERDALRLAALGDGRGRDVVRSHLRALGMGDKANLDPIQVGTVPRLVDMLSVLYSSPATRTLLVGGTQLDHDAPEMRAFRALSSRMQLDQIWARADRMRNLLRQCVVLFCENPTRQTVTARVFEPFNVYRMLGAQADTIEDDRAVAFKVIHATKEADCIYQVWIREDGPEGAAPSWRCWIANDKGETVGVQPYGDEGVPPFASIPAVIVTDEALLGRAWLPMPQGRLALALNIDAVANDVQLLVKHEGHTQLVITGADEVPDEIGPDKLIKLPAGSDAKRLPTSPKIDEAGRTTERYLMLLALSESLPVDAFSVVSQSRTGAALKIAERDLERRRMRHADLAQDFEALAFEKYTAIARALGYPSAPEGAELAVTFARQYLPMDPLEAQKLALSELAIGVKSKIEYIADARAVTNEEARIILDRVEEELAKYPVHHVPEVIGEAVSTSSTSTTQSGPTPAGVARSFNPDLPNSTHGGSLVDTVRAS